MPGSDMCLEPVAKNEMVNTTDVVCSGVLKDLSMAPLRRLWHQRMGRGKDPPGIRSLLLRELAWHDQQAVQGGMDTQNRALLRSAIKHANNAPDQLTLELNADRITTCKAHDFGRTQKQNTRPASHLRVCISHRWNVAASRSP